MARPTFEEMKPQLLAALKHIHEHGPIEPGYGICCNVTEQMNSQATKEQMNSQAMKERIYYSQLRIGRGLADYFARWPGFSGDHRYPVEGSREQYDESVTSGAVWDRKRKYGALRWELLDFLIEELEKEMQDATN